MAALLRQRALFDVPGEECPIQAAVSEVAIGGGVEGRGAIYTRAEVVEFILDLVGYVPEERDLTQLHLLEPSSGGGDFLHEAIRRLLVSAASKGMLKRGASRLARCIRAVELHADTFEATKIAVTRQLTQAGITRVTAKKLADAWLVQGDFLLTEAAPIYDVVVGNPPYVRQESIHDTLLSEYRQRFTTLYDRADLYVPFIEHSLNHLSPGGLLGFICADRWTKNKYGGPLRNMVTSDFALRVFVDMTDTPAFQQDVIAYPAITIIERGEPTNVRVAARPDIDRDTLTSLARSLRGEAGAPADLSIALPHPSAGPQPWLLGSASSIELVRRLERQFPAIEEVGCKVGIGVATGADAAFIGKFDELDVEDDRKLPVAMTRDIASGRVEWRGYGVINPFTDAGPLVKLEDFPKLRHYLEARRDQIDKRHVAQKAPANWYRTIDRITPGLAQRPKLLIPDIKGEAQVVYEEGKLYPHHNLYYVVSDEWDLMALQAVLLSAVAKLFVSTYSTKMRGGFLRFQAQYLRRIRLPRWEHVPLDLRASLSEAAELLDIPACNAAAARLYGITRRELEGLTTT